jgi:hypothetical protein
MRTGVSNSPEEQILFFLEPCTGSRAKTDSSCPSSARRTKPGVPSVRAPPHVAGIHLRASSTNVSRRASSWPPATRGTRSSTTDATFRIGWPLRPDQLSRQRRTRLGWYRHSHQPVASGQRLRRRCGLIIDRDAPRCRRVDRIGAYAISSGVLGPIQSYVCSGERIVRCFVRSELTDAEPVQPTEEPHMPCPSPRFDALSSKRSAVRTKARWLRA